MITCCYTQIDRQWSEQELADKLALLPEELQQQALRKRRWIDRQLAIAGKLLLLRVLKEFESPVSLSDLRYSEYHRPYFDGGFDFNIAHSGNMVICCGTVNGRAGIDIEEIKEIDITDYDDYFTTNEWGRINNYLNKYDGFYDFWTRKEAVLKALGTGLYTSLVDIDVTGDSVRYKNITYHIQALSIGENYKSHIATTEKEDTFKLIKVIV